MSKQERGRAVASFNLGDKVRIKDYEGQVGRIVGLRGALGPGGATVYRVLVQRKPTATYIELLDSQLEAVPAVGSIHVVNKPRTALKSRKSR